jgi:glyoxylase-like metal-dependent hydrolase (beta-lactamase superfamily II)
MRLGEFELFSLSDGFFALDGGAMFGVVPKVFWQKSNPPDDRNRITLALRPLLIKIPAEVTPQRSAGESPLVLMETGVGDKQDTKFQEIYKVKHESHLLDSLRAAGFRPEDVTHVINSHLHFDHCGGNTKGGTGGGGQGSGNQPPAAVPTFPNAKYYVQAKEWATATNPDKRSKASYLPENFMPVFEAGQLVQLQGDAEIVPGVSVVHTGGHTGGHQLLIVRSQGKTAIYWGDLIPTASHINVPYVMGYDTMPLQTMDQKEKLLKQALAENWLMFFEHDPEVCCGYLAEESGKYSVRPAEIE